MMLFFCFHFYWYLLVTLDSIWILYIDFSFILNTQTIIESIFCEAQRNFSDTSSILQTILKRLTPTVYCYFCEILYMIDMARQRLTWLHGRDDLTRVNLHGYMADMT